MMKRLPLAVLGSIFLIISCSSNTKELSKEKFGEDWPFKVESGTVECLDGFEVVFHTEGQTYALNDAARVTGKFGNIKDILRPDANYPGKKIMMDLSLIEFEGLKLCEK